jgi:hypothetical protein
MRRICQLDTDQQLGDGDRSDGNVILVADQVVEPQLPAFAGDQDGRVQDQPGQFRSSSVTTPRSAASSSGHDGSAA